MEVSVIVTVLNESDNITRLTDALLQQSKKPQEIIIVDGGSSDDTFEKLKSLAKKHSNFKVFQKNGNRSVGRNFAISKSSGNWIAITDAGCVPEKNWLENLIKTAQNSGTKVVAGYYQAAKGSLLQQAIAPYALVMPDKINPNNFLPATRSMLIAKKTFDSLGGFDEKLSDNEDYAFAKKIEANIKIAFAQNAVVTWSPPNSLFSFFKMIFRFARGDAQARIFRPKVFLIFGRYILGGTIFGWLIFYQDYVVAVFYFLLAILLYSVWSIKKNIKYCPDSWHLLPILQITSDLAVISGSILGILA